MDSARCQRGMEAPSGNPRQMHRSAGCKRQLGAFSFGYFSFDCMDAGGRAMQEQLPRANKEKYLAFGCENPIQKNCRAATH